MTKTTFTLNIENNSAYLDSEVFINITGKNEATTAQFYLAKPTDASLTGYDDTAGTLLQKNLDGSFVGNGKFRGPAIEPRPEQQQQAETEQGQQDDARQY